jgi:hypothetical protein
MLKRVSLLVLSALMAALAAPLTSSCAAPPEPLDDNTILSLILTSPFADGGYTVVSPRTSLDGLGTTQYAQTSFGGIGYIRAYLRVRDYDLTGLIDILAERNKESTPLTIASSIRQGYYIDYENKFSRYFEKGGGGWEQLRAENPWAHGMTTISLPAYDPKTGIILVYIGTQWDWTTGEGRIYAFQYRNGVLKELKSVELWIS